MTYEDYLRQAWSEVAERARELGIDTPSEDDVSFEERADDGGRRRRLAQAHIALLDALEKINGHTN